MPTSPFLVLRDDNDDSHKSFSIFENDEQKRGFVIVIVLSVFATVGMLALILTLVLLKNKRDRRKKAAKMDAEKGSLWPGAKKGRYQKVDDDERDGVWSAEMEMEDRGAYSGAGYGEGAGRGAGGVGKEPYRPADARPSS